MIIIVFIIGIVWIGWNVLQMPRMKLAPHSLPSVSICIPLRNVEGRVPGLISNLKKLQYERLEILLYDDASDDLTVPIVERLIKGDCRFTLWRGGDLPVGWKGKPHACYQLATKANGQFLLFIDPNVDLSVHSIDACVATMMRRKCDALSGVPKFINKSYLEKLLTPLFHFTVYMHLPIRLANLQHNSKASVACGTFICVKKQAYVDTGGHLLVKDTEVDDLKLFRELKKYGYKAMLFHVADFVQFTMYRSSREKWERLSKYCFAAFGYSYVISTGVLIFYATYYVSPLLFAFYGLYVMRWTYFIPYICITIQRMVSDVQARQLNRFSLLMPISAACYCALLLWAMIKRLRKRETAWKGRVL